jgi:hypothetical protein
MPKKGMRKGLFFSFEIGLIGYNERLIIKLLS